jgi:hypothetical protein
MTEAARILEAIKASSVTRVAFVDDAFDAPEISEADWGELRQYLCSSDAEKIRIDAHIDEADWLAAIDGIDTAASEPIDELLHKLYAVYVQAFEPKFDPMGRFKEIKGANLAYVRPLLALVRQASPDITIQLYGSEPEADDVNGGPHVVFVDLFLHASVSPDEAPSPEHAKNAVQKSIDRIKPLLKLSPSVILMSSHPTAPEREEYRKGMEDQSRTYASRFGFVNKKNVSQDTLSGSLNVDPQASDTLLDLFQTYKFGRSLHETLSTWLEAAHAAVDSLKTELDELALADLAYLIRFRLSEEGQRLPDYLEWLLGECLLDEVGRKIDDRLPRSQIDKEAKDIEGAFDGPTRKVADLYHRVRIENKRANPREHFRLGDLYLRTPEKGDPHLVAVMTPDCDLMLRPPKANEPAKRNAHAALTLLGSLETFKATTTSVGDFIVVDNIPHNIKWDYRAVLTMPFDGAFSQAGHSEGELRYLGALRPMYAQEIQANLLNQLGRVGVPVPPALAFASTVSLTYSAKGGRLKTTEFQSEETSCYFVPARQSGREGILLFRRQFIRELIAQLEKIDGTTLSPAAAGNLKNLLSDAGRAKLRKLTSEGAELEKDIAHGLFLTKKRAKLGDQSPYWACIIVSMKHEVPVAEAQPPEEVVIASAEPMQPARIAEAAAPENRQD